jgi:hypothetical protein
MRWSPACTLPGMRRAPAACASRDLTVAAMSATGAKPCAAPRHDLPPEARTVNCDSHADGIDHSRGYRLPQALPDASDRRKLRDASAAAEPRR